ncbi:TPA: hypothetical protein DIV55_01120 [Patescibacteria group bacterium]|uniref:Putative DNA methylase n=1 Tax=Candidatus Gottesmanbacteria bacterium GW2011_GWA1_43_11 TaxID=1618436 RepID=A0A0G1EPV4_9BACT|nr:MAG: putative DNA methylase [Candidatus Gottesmanbacteria bacterium GW2011_GWA1_43_11]HCS78324.1 hypothetical protein [Patescibacteria group bacterium]
MSYSYLFVLGVSPELCFAELKSVLTQFVPDHTISWHQHPLVCITFPDPPPVAELNKRLGGTVKIARSMKQVELIDAETLLSVIPSETKNFGLSNYSQRNLPIMELCKEVKALREPQNLRYVLPKESGILQSIVVLKQNITELICFIDQNKQWGIAQTVAVQNSEDWSKRDFGRPFADPSSGMLPPKVARMMLNLVVTNKPQLILDPFCGMGTVVAEGLLLGQKMIGSDINHEVITKARANLTWFIQTYRLDESCYGLETGDATHVSELVPAVSIDAIVTEPFLGTAFEKQGEVLMRNGKPVTQQNLDNTFTGLEKLYRGVLREWTKVLKPGGFVVIVLPEVSFGRSVFRVKKMIDNCEKLGYTVKQGSLQYARPQAVVKRQIYVFRKI